MIRVGRARPYDDVRGAMNCATTNAFFVNEKLLFRNGITKPLNTRLNLDIMTNIYLGVSAKNDNPTSQHASNN